jgi:acetone carboxylase, gamma subunit
VKLDKDTLRDLIDEKLPRAHVRAIQSSYKDPDRFDKYVAILQERVRWSEPIVLPFGEHLYLVKKTAHDGQSPSIASAEGRAHGDSTHYVIKCDCGHEFCDYRENWKLEALIYVRESEEDLREIYPQMMSGDARWNCLREYFCPGCKTLLEVEAVPTGYPVIHDFLPDLEGFYEHWLERELPS